MDRPPETLKSFANRLAGVAGKQSTPELVRLLRLGGLLGESDKAVGRATDITFGPPPDPDHVGIWERKIENGKECFVRRLDMITDWDYWFPHLGRIEKKGSKKRVVLIGESVARGYLYDPEFTPAMALQIILEPFFAEGIEVIDLARTNLSHEIKHLAVSALQLEPDITILFAGNNWGVAFPGASDIAQLDEALSTEGMPGVKRTADMQIERIGRRILNDVAEAYESKGIPVVWIIPEFNLADWRDVVTNPPHLGKDLNREWLSVWEQAQDALGAGNLSRAEELARKLLEIDHGLSQAGFYILAECCRRENDIEGQRKYLEMARDAGCWDSSRMLLPRTYSLTQQVMREEAGKHKNQIVDSPALFKEYLNGEIPGRRLYLDYCHLSTEGIQVTMAAAAACVLRSLQKKEVHWRTLVADHVAPPVKTEAEALFLASILNGHWWQSYDLTRYYCTRALSLSPHIGELMLTYIDLQTRHIPPRIRGEAERHIHTIGSRLMHHFLLVLNEKRLDRVLLDAMVDALEEFGFKGRELLDRIRREDHSVAFREINLLDFYYCSSADQPQELAWTMRIIYKFYKPHFEPKYYRAFGTESKFIFVGTAGCPVRLSLTCRLPNNALGEAPISVGLNGKSQAEMMISRQWSSWEITLAGDSVREGLNEVTVRWPVPEFESGEALEKVVTNLFNFWELKFPNFFPVFGEIHSFTASGVPVTSTTPAVQPELATVAVS
jgi:hypothetical protein